MEDKNKNDINFADIELADADAVADEILEKSGKNRKLYIILLLFLLITLLFLVSTITFALMGASERGNDNVYTTGSVLFSYNESSNSISILNALPMEDSIGKTMSDDKEYFSFNISVGFDKENKKKDEVNYEISLVPSAGNTLDPQYIRVYLTENDKSVLTQRKEVNNFSDLADSKIRTGGKVLHTVSTKKDKFSKYVLRMWISKDFPVGTEKKVFKCYVTIDTY